MFVTTADPMLEPPIVTVLSLMALDYPANKLACYVSDDSCSPLYLHALFEASKLAKLWVPFCKKYNVKVRAPFKYFSDESLLTSGAHNSWQLHQNWKKMKKEYEPLSRSIEDADQKSAAFGFKIAGELSVFSNIEPQNHPTIVKTRVSGLMTNAPFMLNVDCDMFTNNPQLVRQAMFWKFKEIHQISCSCFERRQRFPILDLSNSFDVAHQVAGSAYEYASQWQSQKLYVVNDPMEETCYPCLEHRYDYYHKNQRLDQINNLICYPLPTASFVYTPQLILLHSQYLDLFFVVLAIIHFLSISSWWNNQNMTRIITVTSWIFGVLNAVLKFLGFSETIFEIIKKDLDDHQCSTSSNDDNIYVNADKFIFDKSAFFVLGTTILLMYEVVCSLLVVLWFRPFVEGLFRKGKYGIPLSTISKSTVLTLRPLRIMKILCWNVAGMGNPCTLTVLKKVLKIHSLNLVFLSKAKLKGTGLKFVPCWLKEDECSKVKGILKGCWLRKKFVGGRDLWGIASARKMKNTISGPADENGRCQESKGGILRVVYDLFAKITGGLGFKDLSLFNQALLAKQA
ncbi:hypothetical protein ACOSP7_002718 [Xanthoceras sorbifolium]